MLTDPAAGPVVVGHRGASGRYPENTLLAFQKAVDAGADAIELDVRVSADGTPIVIHDETIDRTTDGSGAVSGLSSRDLKRIYAGRGERIPHLAEVLHTFPRLPILIDIKEPEASQPVLEVLVSAGAGRSILVGSFIHAALAPFRRVGIPTTGSRLDVGVFWLASRVGVRLFTPRYRAFSVPEWWGRLRVVDRGFVEMAKRGGLPVHVWEVDDPVEAQRLWEQGVSGIITNFPDEMCRARSSCRRDGPSAE